MNAGSPRWTVLSQQACAEALLTDALKISPLLARILVQRGHDTPEKAEYFLNPRLKNLGDPFALPSLRDAAARVWQAIERGERIVIYGDYDVDGVTSTALLFRVLRAFGGHVSHFLPRRMEEGYGLSADGMERCLEETRPQLLIAVDCGTTAAREVAELKRRGVEVMVLDHHSAGGERPSCLVINPKMTSNNAEGQARSGTYHLATVGLVFKLCHGFLKLGRGLGKPVHEFDLRQFLDLVAVGTVADVVPLEGENRILVKAGLEQLARTTNVGLHTLKEIAGVPERLNPHHIGFQIGPRLNAMGRLSDALASLELLLTENPARARELAATLDQCNRERQEIEQRTFEEAAARLGGVSPLPLAIVLAQEGWHIGVIGIVAARVMRQFHRPTAIIGLDGTGAGKGSCRSVEGFPIVDALQRCEKLLIRFGGHQAAAGFSIEAKNVESFRIQFEAVARQMLHGEALQPTIRACADVPLHSITPELMNELAMLEPFGTSNPQPVFVARAVPLRSAPRTVGTGHLKLWLGDRGQSFDAIKFGVGDWQPKGDRVDIAFTPHWNEYQGKRTIQLKMMDVREAANGNRES